VKTLIVIPARFQSSRYPGKPLVSLTGATGVTKTLIERTWDAGQGISGADKVVVATDDARIADHVTGFGGTVVMTSSDCRNGTERCAEVAEKAQDFDLIVNLQGDAPLTPPWFLEGLTSAMKARLDVDVATPVLNCTGAMRDALLAERKAGRVGGTTAVFDQSDRALYFSKEVLPFSGQSFAAEEPTPVWHHVGVYAYRPTALAAYMGMKESPAERNEGLEQLRFLENAIPVLCVKTEAKGRDFWELNNPEDVPKIEAMMKIMGIP
jgi:3-deoxy-manno-octulosonate cytidylyltransferase (CMP-KDO synthetase)